jgi:3-hydroxyisobutyrate dehydrogenase-like beta-hydroxyacid dehydrogenase
MNTTSSPPCVALLGIGRMGLPMASRLCQAGLTVHAWNRNQSRADPLRPLGAHVHALAADAVRQADIVISMLENGPVVEQVLFAQSAAAAMRPGTLVVDMASIKPAEARDHAQRLQAMGLRHIDAPVSGGTVAAEAGTLAIMAGGEADDLQQALPVLQHLGSTVHVGPHGAGQLAKLANQMIVGITIGAVSEALLMCAKGGADMAKVREAIGGGFAGSRILQLHGQRMVDRDFAPRATMTVQRKDMRNALDTAAALDFQAPITELFERLYSEAIDHGLADLDHSGLFVELARRNGMA